MPITLSPRERVRRALCHQETDRVPMAMVCSGFNRPVRVALEALLLQEYGLTLDTYLRDKIDLKTVSPQYIGPPLPAGTDYWGIHRSMVSYGEDGYEEIDIHPLAQAASIDDLATFRWPDPDWFDYAGIVDQIAAIRAEGDYAIMAIGCGNPFETSWYLRGFEQTFVDLIEQPEFTHTVLERVTQFGCEMFRRMLAVADGAIDLAFTADDIAGQQGLLMSLDMWAAHLKPYHERLNAVIHELGAKVIYHSDGAVMEAVPGLIDMGIDVLQALQFDADGMDPAVLQAQYGDRLCFEGGVSVQQTLPFGTPDAVRTEVRHLIATIGRQGGYILGPSHAIQTGTPPENIVAMFEEASVAGAS